MTNIEGSLTYTLKTDNWFQFHKSPSPVHTNIRYFKTTYTRPFTSTNKIYEKPKNSIHYRKTISPEQDNNSSVHSKSAKAIRVPCHRIYWLLLYPTYIESYRNRRRLFGLKRRVKTSSISNYMRVEYLLTSPPPGGSSKKDSLIVHVLPRMKLRLHLKSAPF